MFFHISTTLLGQEIGKVVFDVSPTSALIKINNQILSPAEIGEAKTSIELPYGSYKVEIWAYGMEMYEQEINIDSSEIINIATVLKPREDYVAFRKELDNFYTNKRIARRRTITKNFMRYIPTIVSGGYYLAQRTINLNAIDRHKRDAEYYSGLHDDFIDPDLAKINRQNYDFHKSEYDRIANFQKTLNYIAIPTITILGGYGIQYTIRTIKNSNPEVPPVFSDESPFSSIDINLDVAPLNYHYELPQQMSFGLNFNF